MYFVRQIPKDREGYTWTGTDLKDFFGVGHVHNLGCELVLGQDNF